MKRIELAAAYRICSLLNLDDLTYTHISVRAENQESFYILPFGLCFDEITASCLLQVDFSGKVLVGEEYQYNRTGYVIHGNVYRARPDIQAIFHLHTPAITAVSATKSGLIFATQWSLHFYNRINYHGYNSLTLDTNDNILVRDLGDKKVLMMQNHGALTCGSTIQEAFFYTYHLEQACKAQCLMPAEEKLIIPAPSICQKSVQDLLSFEKDLGKRDWLAMLRKLEKLSPEYKK